MNDVTEQTDQQPSPALLWTAAVDPPAATAMAVAGEDLFLATQAAGRGAQHSDLMALDIETGAERWRQHFDYALVSGLQPYFLQEAQQTVVVVATRGGDLLHGRGQVLAFDLSGEIIWSWQGEEKSYSAPVAREMQLLVLAGDNTLVIVSPEAEGDDVIRIRLPVSTSLAAPAVQDNLVYIPCRGPEVVAVDLEGTVRWHFEASGSRHAWLDRCPVLYEATLFAVSRQGIVYALNAISGKLLWQKSIDEGRALSQPAVAQGRLFVGHRRGLTALDAGSGQVEWTYETSRPVSAAPLVIGETVYAAGQDHYLAALDAWTGAIRWTYETARRIELAPIQAAGRLYLADRGGAVVAMPLPDEAGPAGAEEGRKTILLAGKRIRAAAWEAEGHHQQAARLWLECGDLEKAALAYEAAGLWLEAAGLWQQLDRYGKRADALVQHADWLGQQEVDDEEKAAAWSRAARAHAEIGQQEARRDCERKAAQYRRQPILTVEIEPEPMQFNAWSKLDFVIHNEGFGAARAVLVSVVDDRFEGQAIHTQTRATILPNRAYQHWLDVLPKAQGSEVPMRLTIDYMDASGIEHRLERTFYLSVAGEGQPITPYLKATDSDSFARLESPDGRDLALLRQQIVDHFNREELLDILFDLGLRADDFDERISSVARDLITYAVQANRLDELIELCRQRRPGVDW